MLNAASPAKAIFDAIRHVFPFAGGLVEAINSASSTEPLHAVYHVPDSFLLSRAQHVAIDLAIPFALHLPVGIAARGADALPGRLFMEHQYSQIMYPHYGFSNVSGIVITKSARGGEVELDVIWLFTETNARLPTWRDARLLELVHRDIQQTICRLRIPLLPHEPIRYQIMREQRVGYMLVGPGGAIREANRRAALLAHHYTPMDTPLKMRLTELLARVHATPPCSDRPVRYLHGSNGAGFLEVGTHKLTKETHAIDEDLVLVEMREIPLPEGSFGGSRMLLEKLTPRQREVALLLSKSDLSYKEIANALELKEGTARKHVEHIYRALRVQSRSELIILLNGIDRRSTLS
ncbi:helix-turn-helix transcriptional regulator [Polyangium sp. 6x1]|uniref:helix-turn-helix transcriptional regulator n=1 Tax=Polyangium sp. 6x1 TaxID=3042689 RepID=UPI0024829517|nr:helix-turn-helix transcriptional regulator [Polyangium sp. 6x1]MDI1451539.1 helix-turn-helix transcriptional regulator [Polyangium sp. 6x1]